MAKHHLTLPVSMTHYFYIVIFMSRPLGEGRCLRSTRCFAHFHHLLDMTKVRNMKFEILGEKIITLVILTNGQVGVNLGCLFFIEGLSKVSTLKD